MASAAPSHDESVLSLLTALDTDKHNKICLVSHSLGCSFVSWMLHHPLGKLLYICIYSKYVCILYIMYVSYICIVCIYV